MAGTDRAAAATGRIDTWLQQHAPRARAALRPPAPEACETWPPAWLPVATNHGGGNLFVNLRGGPSNGCVMKFYRDTGALAQPPWADVADMLDDIAERLEEGEAELDDSGRIDWP